MFTRKLLLGALMLAIGPLAARADLLVTTRASGLSIQLYSNSGALESGSSNLFGIWAESLDCLTFAQDGTVYAIGNTLGEGNLFRIPPGQKPSVSNGGGVINVPIGLGIGSGYVFVGSTNAGFSIGPQTGVLEFNAATGAFVRNALPLSTPPSPHQAESDVQVGPDGELYVSAGGVVSRYAIASTGTLTLDTQLADGNAKILFHAGSTDFYLRPLDANNAPTGTLFGHYDEDGNLLGTLQLTGAPSSVSFTSGVSSYAFGDDGILYAEVGSAQALPGLPAGNHILRFNAQTGAYIDSILNSGSNEISNLNYVPSAIAANISLVPEPASLLLLGSAIPVLYRRRRHR